MQYADSDDDHVGRNDDRDLDQWEAIDMADYEYHPDQHTLDALSLFFQNIPDMLDIVEDDIEKAVETMAIPQHYIDIPAMEFQEALDAGLVPPLNQEAGRLFTNSESLLQNYAHARALTASDVKWMSSEIIWENYASDLGIPLKTDLSKWNPAEVNTILKQNLVPCRHGTGHLRTFGCIQWEWELFNGRPKALCYPFYLDGHCFQEKNPKVTCTRHPA